MINLNNYKTENSQTNFNPILFPPKKTFNSHFRESHPFKIVV